MAIEWKPPEKERSVFVGDVDWFIAEDAEAVPALADAVYGDGYNADCDCEWTRLGDCEKVTMNFEDEEDAVSMVSDLKKALADLQQVEVLCRVRGDHVRDTRWHRWSVGAPAAEWAHLPSGLLCSTEW